MKCTVPEISWHNRDPVYSVDIQPKTNSNEDFYRLASGGTDSHVVIWYMYPGNNGKDTRLEFAADLQRHQRAVNIVRFSPNGELLASGDDEAVIILWKLKSDQDYELPPMTGEEESKDKERWISYRTLRKHVEDVYDLCWSPDSTGIVSGSIDNTAIVWNVEKGRSTGILGEHKGFVQGVAWDPKNKYIATLSTDRTFRVFNVDTRKQVSKVFKMKSGKTKALTESNGESQKQEGQKEDKGMKLFHDDTLKTFFRRLCFSPDGELIITPCGIVEDELYDGKPMDATFIFTKNSLNRPVLHLPSPGQYSVAVRCCPILFKLRDNVKSVFALPYRIVFAVATKNTVVLYDTQQLQPFGFVSNIHYTGLTDLTWSSDGRVLVISSTEGYCSLITFEEGEIGTPYDNNKNMKTTETNKNKIMKSQVMDVSDLDEQINEIKVETVETKSKTKTTPTKKPEEQIQTTPTKGPDQPVQTTPTKGPEQPMQTTPTKGPERPMQTTLEANTTPTKGPKQPMQTTPESKTTPTKKPEEPIQTTPIKSRIESVKNDESIFKSPMRLPRTPERSGYITPEKMEREDSDSCSFSSELSLNIDGDEEELMSKIEQAKRLISKSPSTKGSPSSKKKQRDVSPTRPDSAKRGRRVDLVTLSSPKTKNKKC